jgi:hypothetical protein
MYDAMLTDLVWEAVLIAGVFFLGGVGLGALAYHIIWGRTLNSR